MGVFYTHLVIPRDNAIRPGPDQIIALIEAWIERGYVVETGARFQADPQLGEAQKWKQAPEPPRGRWARLFGKAQKHKRLDPRAPFSFPPVGDSLQALAHQHTVIEWNGNSGVKYPMHTGAASVATGDHTVPYRLIIELSEDFVNPHTDPFGDVARQVDPTCQCGRDLQYEGALGWLATEKIRQVCPACSLTYQPQNHVAEIVNGITGARFPQPGGLCNRFAIIIYFGKEWPRYEYDLAEPRATPVFLDTCSAALGIELNEFSYYS